MKDLVQRILSLKSDKNAIILAHNYQPAVIQEIADMTGDSLELSRKAASTDAKIIVFCGVGFMAETAAILNPDKTVLLPRLDAGCPMAEMITRDDMVAIRREHPGIPIVTYVNSTAAVKAESDSCCTSANSVRVVESFADMDTVFMAPDQNLAKYTARHTNKRILFWHGQCPIHHKLSANEVMDCKRVHPEALLLAHPECRPEVIDLADEVQSTSGMLRFVQDSPSESFIIATEEGILHTMRKQNPQKRFYPAADSLICPDMKKISLEDLVRSIETLEPRVTVPEEIRVKALDAVTRMLSIG